MLHRTRIYRHSSDHPMLNPNIEKKYSEFWNEDTKDISDESEKFFVVQQRLLESFLTAIQVEMAGF